MSSIFDRMSRAKAKADADAQAAQDRLAAGLDLPAGYSITVENCNHEGRSHMDSGCEFCAHGPQLVMRVEGQRRGDPGPVNLDVLESLISSARTTAWRAPE